MFNKIFKIKFLFNLKNNRKVGNFVRKFGIVIGLLILSLTTSLLSKTFLTYPNLINILRQVSINGILAVGMTLVILSGGIDLSVGSVLAISGALVANFMEKGFLLAIVIALGIGSILGIINGSAITKLNIPPFIATLGMLTIGRGMTLAYTKGYPLIPADNRYFRFIGAGYLGPVPVPVIILVVTFIFFYILLSKTRFGLHIYAVGGNEEAAALSGVNVDNIRLLVYTISGLLSALAAIVLTSRLYSAGPRAGVAYELDAIAAAVIGGASLMGGEGSIFGTLIGVLIFGVISNSFNLLGVPAPYQEIFKGIIIMGAVGMDMYTKGKEK